MLNGLAKKMMSAQILVKEKRCCWVQNASTMASTYLVSAAVQRMAVLLAPFSSKCCRRLIHLTCLITMALVSTHFCFLTAMVAVLTSNFWNTLTAKKRSGMSALDYPMAPPTGKWETVVSKMVASKCLYHKPSKNWIQKRMTLAWNLQYTRRT